MGIIWDHDGMWSSFISQHLSTKQSTLWLTPLKGQELYVYFQRIYSYYLQVLETKQVIIWSLLTLLVLELMPWLNFLLSFVIWRLSAFIVCLNNYIGTGLQTYVSVSLKYAQIDVSLYFDILQEYIENWLYKC